MPNAKLIFSEEVHAPPLAEPQLNVLSVDPFNVKPPPFAEASDGLDVSPRVMFLSATSSVEDVMVVVVPFTVKLPEMIKSAAFTVPVKVGLDKVGLALGANVSVTSLTADVVATLLLLLLIATFAAFKVAPVASTVPEKMGLAKGANVSVTSLTADVVATLLLPSLIATFAAVNVPAFKVAPIASTVPVKVGLALGAN